MKNIIKSNRKRTQSRKYYRGGYRGLSKKRRRYLRAYRWGKIYKIQISARHIKYHDYYKLYYRRRIQRDPDYFRRYHTHISSNLGNTGERVKEKSNCKIYTITL